MFGSCDTENTVIHPAGVGTRNYYRKMGYELEGPYMVKDLYRPGAD